MLNDMGWIENRAELVRFAVAATGGAIAVGFLAFGPEFQTDTDLLGDLSRFAVYESALFLVLASILAIIAVFGLPGALVGTIVGGVIRYWRRRIQVGASTARVRP
jgi:hypothetical protein